MVHPFDALRSLLVAAVMLAGFHLAASTSSAQPAPTGGSVLSGRVVDARTGNAIPNAVVSIPTVSRNTRADSSGRFRLSGLAPGSLMVTVTAVGFRPATTSLVLAGGKPVELDVELEPFAPLLDGVLTTASADAPRNAALPEFESRRTAGLGRFLTRDQMLADRGRSLDAVLARFAGVRVVNYGHMRVAASGRAGGRITSSAPCLLNVIVDGVLRYQNLPGIDPFDLRSLEASMIAAIEVHTVATLPAEFNMGSNTACGALVIWLQH